jgi:hypothetical protein
VRVGRERVGIDLHGIQELAAHEDVGAGVSQRREHGQIARWQHGLPVVDRFASQLMVELVASRCLGRDEEAGDHCAVQRLEHHFGGLTPPVSQMNGQCVTKRGLPRSSVDESRDLLSGSRPCAIPDAL